MKTAKTLVSSLIISGGAYFGYQLKLGEYSGCGEIIEVKVPAKRFHFFEIEQSYYKSELEVSKFINEMVHKNIFGTFHKIQLNDPASTSSEKRFLIGIEETADNSQKLERLNEKLKVKEFPEYSAIESFLNYDKKSQLFIALQMTFNVQTNIENYVQKNAQQFQNINTNQYLKTITIGSNKKFIQTAISYPFGEGSKVFQEFAKPSNNQSPPEQQQQIPAPQKESVQDTQ